MRIDAYTTINQGYNTKKTRATANSGYSQATDRVEISSFGQSFQIAKNALKAAPEVREELVADVKKRYDNGEFDVDDEKAADMLIEKYFGSN